MLCYNNSCSNFPSFFSFFFFNLVRYISSQLFVPWPAQFLVVSFSRLQLKGKISPALQYFLPFYSYLPPVPSSSWRISVISACRAFFFAVFVAAAAAISRLTKVHCFPPSSLHCAHASICINLFLLFHGALLATLLFHCSHPLWRKYHHLWFPPLSLYPLIILQFLFHLLQPGCNTSLLWYPSLSMLSILFTAIMSHA